MVTTRLKVLTAILIASLSFLIYDTYQRSSAANKPTVTATGAPSPTTQTGSLKPETKPEAPPSRTATMAGMMPTEMGWGRNPFFSATTEEVITSIEVSGEGPKITEVRSFNVSELNVSAITWTPGGARALINGKVLGIGDIVESMMIIEIDEQSVTLRGGGRTLTLEVGS